MDSEDEVETTEERYIYLDFGDNVKQDLFQNEIFFRLANVETETPLVQLNDVLFKGEYEDCIGTNLFFEDLEDAEPRDLFEGESSIHLKHTVTQYKVLTLHSVQIPAKWKDMPEPEYDIKINVNYDYETLLKKFTDGTLSLTEDFVKVPKCPKQNNIEVIPAPMEVTQSEQSTEKLIDSRVLGIEYPEDIKIEVNYVPENGVEQEDVSKKKLSNSPKKLQAYENICIADLEEEVKVESVDIISYKYEKLKELVMRPTRRKVILDPMEPCDPKYQRAYEYNSLKCQVMMPSDYFRTISKDYNKETLVGVVDIDRSVLQGVVKQSSEFYRVLTEDEKAALLSMENLENLSMLGRYWVLKSQLEHFQTLKLTMPGEEVLEEDKYNRTIDENISIYKRLVRIVSGLLEQNYCYDSDQETVDEDSSDNSSLKEADGSEILSDDSMGQNCTEKSATVI